MSEELVQGKYAGLMDWRIQREGEDGWVEVMPTTRQAILEMPPDAEILEGAMVIRTIMVDQIVPFCVKDGEVVLDA